MLTTPLTCKAAFEKFLSIYGHGHIWLKTGHSDFWKGSVELDECTIFKTKRLDNGHRKLIGQSYDAYTELRKISEYKGGGVFFIPGRPSDAPLKQYHTGSDFVSCEMDDGTTEEQLARIEWFTETSGLDWALIIGSGGKSKHPHLKASEWLGVEQRLYLQKLLNMAMRSDPAVNNPHQPMRVPGFYRKEKEKEQTLDYYSDSAYSYEQLLKGIGKVFECLDWKLPSLEQLTREGEGTTLWGEIQRVLKRKKLKDFDYSELTDDDVVATIKDLLDKPTDYFDKLHQSVSPTPPEEVAEIKRTLKPVISNPGNGTVDLFDCLYPYYQDLIRSGVGAGGAGRDPEGFKLSCHLQQVEEILSRNGIYYSGSGRTLLDEYCSRCSPALSRRDADKLWGRYSRYGHKYQLDEGILLKKVAKLLGVKTPTLKAKAPQPIELFTRRLQHKAEKLKRWWKKQRKFTPTETQNQKYLDIKVRIPDGCIYCIKSGLGTGKTYLLEQWFKPPYIDKKAGIYEEGGQFNHDGAIMLGSRNGLLLQNSIRVGFQHLQSEQCFSELQKPNSRIALCTDSLPHFLDPEWFDGKVLILDECMETINHILTSSTHRKNRAECLKKWAECLKRCKVIICLDGNLSDWAIDKYILKLTGYRKVIKVENTYKGDRAPVEFLIGTGTKKSRLPENIEKPLKEKGLNSRDISPYIPMVLASRCPAIVTDSQKKAESLEYLLNLFGKTGIRVDSKTVADKGHPAKAFLAAPDDWIRANSPDFIILSPSAQSGIDISIAGYFSDVFALFFGVVGTNTQMQMPARVRDPNVQWHIACPEYTRKDGENFSSPVASEVKEVLENYLLQDAATISINLPQLKNHLEVLIKQGLKDNPHHDAYVTLKAKDNYEKANLRECLIEALTEAGHEIKLVEMKHSNEGSDLIKGASEHVLKKEAADIFNAPDIDPNKVQELSAKFDATWEERCQIIKAGYKSRLPGIEDTKIWSKELIYLFRKYRDFISQEELYYFLYNPQHLQEQQQELWGYLALGGMKFLADVRSRHLKIKALEKLNIKQFLESEQPWNCNSPEIKQLLTTARRSKKLSAALGIVPGKDAIKYLQRVVNLLGHKVNYIGRDSKNTRKYEVMAIQGIDKVALDIGEVKEVLSKCLDRKYNPTPNTQEPSKSQSKWEEAKHIYLSLEKIPEDIERAQTAPTPFQPHSLINSGANGVVKNPNLDLYLPPPETPLGDWAIYKDDMEWTADCLELMIDTPPQQQPDLTPLDVFKHQVGIFGWNVIKEASKLNEVLASKVISFVDQLIESGEWHFAPG